MTAVFWLNRLLFVSLNALKGVLLVVMNTDSCASVFEIQDGMLAGFHSFFFTFISTPLTNNNMTSSQLARRPVSKALHWHRRGHGSESRSKLNCFPGFLFRISCVRNFDGHSLIRVLFPFGNQDTLTRKFKQET